MPDLLYTLSFAALPVIVAITLHEAAHGWMALRLGDDTAYRLGRVTFNPLRHVDLVGTVLLPLSLLAVAALTKSPPFLFGWAKPVPVNFNNLRDPRRDMVWVALAGPGINIVLALVSALLLHATPLMPTVAAEWWVLSLQASVLANIILAVFNMIPIPPLDGGRVAVGLLPTPLARPLARLERAGLLIVIAIFFLVPFVAGRLGVELNVIGWLLGPPVDTLRNLIFLVTGFG